MKRYSPDKYSHIYIKESGDLYFVKSINGIRYKRSLKTKKIREALSRAEELENELRKEFDKSDFQRSERKRKGVHNPSLEILWNEFLDNKFPRVEHETRRNYGYQWKNNLSEFFAKRHLKDFNQKLINEWELWFLKNRDIHYFNPRKAMVAFKNYLLKKKYIHSDLEFEKLDKTTLKGKIKVRTKLTFTRSELQTIYNYSADTYGLIFKIAVTTGARVAEITKLKTNQIKSVNGIMHIDFYSFKNKQNRLVLVNKKIRPLIKEQLQKAKNQKSEYLFCSNRRNGKHVGLTSVDRHFGIVLEKMGYPRGVKVFHDIRRSFASMTADNGWPPLVACAILDMSLEIYQKVYCKVSEDAKSKKLNDFDLGLFNNRSIEIVDEDESDV